MFCSESQKLHSAPPRGRHDLPLSNSDLASWQAETRSPHIHVVRSENDPGLQVSAKAPRRQKGIRITDRSRTVY